MIRTTLTGLMLLSLAAPGLAANRIVVASGGGTASNDALRATITVGQSLVGSGSGNDLAVGVGFWPGVSTGTETPVNLAFLRANWANGSAVVEWRIAGEPYDHAGFHVHRAVNDGPRERLTETLLAGRLDYRYADESPPAGRVAYWLEERSREGTPSWHGPVVLELAEQVPVLALAQNAPNPFRAHTRLSFQVDAPGPVAVRVYDVSGRAVATLLDRNLAAGAYELTWDGRSLDGRRVPAGMYFYRLETRSRQLTRKLVIAG